MIQHTHLTASNGLDYDRTLILAVEVSGRSWVVAAQVPGLRQKSAKQQLAPCADALMAAVEGYKRRAAAAGLDLRDVFGTRRAAVERDARQQLRHASTIAGLLLLRRSLLLRLFGGLRFGEPVFEHHKRIVGHRRALPRRMARRPHSSGGCRCTARRARRSATGTTIRKR